MQKEGGFGFQAQRVMVSKIRNFAVRTKSHSVPKVEQRWTILLQMK